MQDAETKKLDQIIVMLADVVATFGDRFDKIGEQLTGLDNKITGVDRRLDAEAMRRNDLKMPRRVHGSRGRGLWPRSLKAPQAPAPMIGAQFIG